MNRKIASISIIAVMATVIFGVSFLNRAVSVSGLKAYIWVSSGLNPFPKVAANDLDIVYVMIMGQPSGGTSPYIVEIWLRQGSDPWQRWSIYEMGMYGGSMPVVWSTNAPTSEAERRVDIYVKITDSMAAVAEQWAIIYIPLSGPTT